MDLSVESYKLECKICIIQNSLLSLWLFCFLFLNYVILPDSLKMCYTYIRTWNRNESVINKKIKLLRQDPNWSNAQQMIQSIFLRLVFYRIISCRILLLSFFEIRRFRTFHPVGKIQAWEKCILRYNLLFFLFLLTTLSYLSEPIL